jgi:hypothetical protein
MFLLGVIGGSALLGLGLAKLDIMLLNRRMKRLSEACHAELDSLQLPDDNLSIDDWRLFFSVMKKYYPPR